jgi:hypothetical protein
MSRRFSWRWITLAALTLVTASAAVPAGASAADVAAARCIQPIGGAYPTRCAMPQYQPATAGLQHVGWTYLNLNYCAPGMACLAIYRDSMSAWSWSGTAWRPSSLRQGWVYVYPYTGSWRWAWTQSTGWVAVTGGRFELRDY